VTAPEAYKADREGKTDSAAFEARSSSSLLRRIGVVAVGLRSLFGGSDRRNGHVNGKSAMSLPPWVNDPVGLWPVRDRGGPMSTYAGPGDAGLIGVLARIELNEEDGVDPCQGLSKDPLDPRSTDS